MSMVLGDLGAGDLGATHPRRLAVVIVFSESNGERGTGDGCGVVLSAGGICDWKSVCDSGFRPDNSRGACRVKFWWMAPFSNDGGSS